VAVFGAGTIGNLVAQVARCSGAQVMIMDLSEYRLNVARQCGLEGTYNSRAESTSDAAQRIFGKDGFDVAFECVGVEPTITAAIANIQKGGTIVVVGVFGEKPRVDLGLVQDRELNLRGTLMYKRADYLRAVELIASGGIVTGPLMSKHFSMDDYLAAYEFIEQQGEKAMKVFIDIA
jgi:threonine dehydrogenase-like Zn-dependent dehydrogenase